MTENKKIKGPWAQRFFVIFLSLILAVLFFWLLGFVTDDIGSLRGPELSKIETKYVDADILEKRKSLKEDLSDLKANIRNRQEQSNILKDSTDSLQNTINQLLSIQKQCIEKNLDFSAENQQTLTENQSLFLQNQKQYQSLNKEIADLTKQRRQLEKELSSLSRQIDRQQHLARKEYNGLRSKHRLKLAALKLAVLVPVFLILAWFFMKKRSGAYGPIIYALFIAVFMKISLVAHEYFPRRYFKYIALMVIIAIVLKLLFYLLKRIVSPKKDWLIKQYQEAYDKNICPICSKPIRIGPLRYAVGRKHKALVPAGQGADSAKQHLYTCPVCGTQLYGKCNKCGDICHLLLPFCEHCGNEKANLTP